MHVIYVIKSISNSICYNSYWLSFYSICFRCYIPVPSKLIMISKYVDTVSILTSSWWLTTCSGFLCCKVARRMDFLSFRDNTLTMANSSRAAKTKSRHIDIQTSIALIYDTRGRFWRDPVVCVVMVRIVRTPSEILAGTASILIQNETQERMTMRALGT